MINQTVARRYAQALFDSGRESGNLDRLEADLADVVSVIEREPALKKALHHPLLPAEDKRKVIGALFGERLSPVTLQLLKLLLEKKRERELPAILDEFRRLVNAARNVMEVEAVVAKPLDDAILGTLRARLQEVSGKQVRLKVHVDPAILGGVLLKVGDRRIDGSLRGRLARMKQVLKEGSL